MDTVRFGRALGIGARGAAKALMAAADAAAAPKPAASPRTRSLAGVAHTVAHLRDTQAGIARGTRRFGETAWRPFLRLGNVLWLEFTGVFFGIFAFFAGTNAWKLRANLHQAAANHAEHQHLLWSLAMAAVFGYFCVSSFLRASRRSRGR